MYIACHFWDPRSPLLLTRKELMGGKVPIRIIADISCDIDGPIASTIRASTIAEPFYGYDPVHDEESEAFAKDSITVMAVDNLPGELPRDASSSFGDALAEFVVPELLHKDSSDDAGKGLHNGAGKAGRKLCLLAGFPGREGAELSS